MERSDTVSPDKVIDQLIKLRHWNKMTGIKRAALDQAIKAVETHEVAKSYVYAIERIDNGNKKYLGMPVYTYQVDYSCLCCGKIFDRATFDKAIAEDLSDTPVSSANYCNNCGQGLKAPRE